jgi:hypothetical protein
MLGSTQPLPRRSLPNRRFLGAVLPGLFVFACVCLIAGERAPAADAPVSTAASTPTDTDALVQHALAAIRQGDLAERDAALAQALAQDRDSALAHALRGEVQAAGAWQSIDAYAPLMSERSLTADYERLRNASSDTVIADQWKLARWCAVHHLPDREQAHLIRILELDPNDAAAHARIGDVKKQGLWYSAEQLVADRELKAHLAKARLHWSHDITQIRTALAGGGVHERESARRKLESIEDVYALPLLREHVATLNTYETGAAVVDRAARSNNPLATKELCRLGTAWPAVQQEVVEQLHRRRADAVLPVLLDSLHSQATIVGSTTYGPEGGLPVLRYVLQREEADHLEQGNFDTTVDTSVQTLVGGPKRTDGFLSDFGKVNLAARVVEAKIAARNQVIAQENAAVSSLLRAVTGNTTITTDPKSWWQWWNDQTETWPYEKPTLYATFRTGEFSLPPRMLTRTYSCFVAGTPVWTPTGLRPIEELKIGDYVLAQHPETGELTYKVVISPSYRRSAPIIRLQLSDEEIQSSGGHLFWVADLGWQRARTLAAGDELASVGRVLPLLAAEATTAEAPMYNLVVADFHTYFVGRNRVLVHDITRAASVNNALPGWRKEQTSVSRTWSFAGQP